MSKFLLKIGFGRLGMNVLFLRDCKARFVMMVVDGEGVEQGWGGCRARTGSSRPQHACTCD